MDEQYPKDQLKAIIDKKAKIKQKQTPDAISKAIAAKVKAKLDQDYQLAWIKANASMMFFF